MKILSRPWFLAALALITMLGTQAAALMLYWKDLFPQNDQRAHVVVRDQPQAFSWGFSSDEIERLRAELASRIAALDAKQSELALYEERLRADRAELEDIKKQVEIMRNSLLDKIVKLEGDETKNLKTLAKTYSTLTPEATVSIFREMDDSTVVKIMFFMKADVVGQILERMAAPDGGAQLVKRAARLSDMLRLFNESSQTAG